MEGLPMQELLARLYRTFAEQFEAGMAEAGFGDVTLAHGTNVLRFVDDDGVRVGVVASRSGLTKQAISQQVKYLEAHGYLIVSPDPGDQRSKLIRQTARGRECRAVARALFSEIEQLWSRRLGAAQAADLRASLEHAAAQLGDVRSSSP